MANDKNFKVKNGVSVGTDVVFEGNNFTTTLTKTEPTANQTITFPNASGTVVLGDGLTTYSVKASSTTGGANLDLDAAGANTNTDSVKFAGAGITVVTQTDASTITITSTEADTLATVTGRGATTATAISITNETDSTGSASGALVVSGGVGISKNLYVGENIVVNGNLTVQGTQTTINTATLDVTDTTINLGVVETPTDVTADGGGIILEGTTDKTILWDDANDNWTSSEHWNLATGKSFKINNTVVLSNTQVLGKGFTDAAGEIVTTDGTQTLTNKTLSGGSASNLTGLSMATGVSITEFSSDGTLAGDSNEAVPTESAVKTYVDDALTTYSIKASSTTGGANLDLDAAGANTGTDSIKFAGAGSVSIAQTDASTITVTGAAPNNGTLTLQTGVAAATNNTVTVATGTGFSADTATNTTYELRIGPALTALASQMTGTGTGFLRKNGADTFSLDTNTYLTSYTETDTLASVTGRGATTATDITLGNGVTTSNTYFGASTINYLISSGNGSMRLKTKDQTTTNGKNIHLEGGNSSLTSSFGGSIILDAGNGTGTEGEGGGITADGGNGTFAGGITLTGGTSTALFSGTSTGGQITIKGGTSSVTSGAAVGGSVTIQGGSAPITDGATKTGGDVFIVGGAISGSNTIRYGNIYVGTTQNGSSGGTQEVHIGNAGSKNYIKGVTEYTTSTEVLNTKTGATGTVVHNLNEGNTWYHSSISANFTANFTNVPTTNNRTIVCSLVLVQGSTAYIPNAVQIDGVAQTINWTGHNGVPTGDANDTNIATFILIRQSNAWSVLGSVVNNPAAAAASTLQAVTDTGATTSNAISITNNTASTSTSTGALTVTGGIGVQGKATLSSLEVLNEVAISGLVTLRRTTEEFQPFTGATGVVVHDVQNANIFYHSSIAGNFTPNLINVPTTNNRTLIYTFILNQGATPYLPTAVQIDGVAQTINWTGSTGTPTGDANDINIATFSLIRTGSAWTVLGSVVNNPTSFVAGGGIGLTGSTFSVAAGTGLTQDTDGLSLTSITAGSTTVGTVRYNGTTKTAGQFDGGTTAPTNTTRLNYDGNFYATNFFGNGSNLTSLNATNLGSGTVPGDRGVTAGSTTASFVEYNGTTKTAGQFDGGTTAPTNTTRLNYDGYLYATRFYGDGSQLTGISAGATITDDTTTNGTRYILFDDVTSGSATSVGVSSTKLYFNPSTGDLSATNFNSLSDVRYKTDLAVIENALDKIKQLTGYTYSLIENGKRGSGLLAQDVNPVLPEAVGGTADKLELNYAATIGLIVEAIKELSDKLDDLKK